MAQPGGQPAPLVALAPPLTGGQQFVRRGEHTRRYSAHQADPPIVTADNSPLAVKRVSPGHSCRQGLAPRYYGDDIITHSRGVVAATVPFPWPSPVWRTGIGITRRIAGLLVLQHIDTPGLRAVSRRPADQGGQLLDALDDVLLNRIRRAGTIDGEHPLAAGVVIQQRHG
jgi:hypothetical protein